jgi:metal-responsive CopG/Arc/MetJ family transcriptional regulator
MAKSIKIAVSLPSDTFHLAENLRRKEKRSRSELYAKALEAYLKADELREMDARYEAGYRAKPESKEDTAWATRASLTSLKSGDW